MLSIPLLKQKTGYTCGPTCISMLARFYGMEVSRNTIMRVSKCDKNGMSNEQMVLALRRLGFRACARNRHSWKDLRRSYKQRFPAVVAWMLHGYVGHFSIVIEVGEHHIMLADPDTGRRRRLPKRVFIRLWFDYDGDFFPVKKRNIHLRWAAVVSGVRH